VFHSLQKSIQHSKTQETNPKKKNTKKLTGSSGEKKKSSVHQCRFWSSYRELRKTPICHNSPKSAKPPTERSEKGNPKECKITQKKKERKRDLDFEEKPQEQKSRKRN
jgi:hypothetical protein